MKNPLVLAIDTSCDETAVAVVRGTQILSNIVASQVELHKEFGGVFPTVAKQAHLENIEPTVKLAMKRARVQWDELDRIAVTQGPGLAPALEVGIRYAEELGKLHQKPVVGINHIEGHLWSVAAKSSVSQPSVERPVLSLIISGGHSEFVLVTGVGQYQRIGWTIDDAAGEALDKVGRMLGLGYPAGPVIERFARLGHPATFTFPLPMTTSRDYNLSFSGLKTFARNFTDKLTADHPLSAQETYDLCASFQYAIFRHICHKLSKILLDHPDLGEVWLGGGVAANVTLRKMIRQTLKKHAQELTKKDSDKPTRQLTLKVPYSKKLCGDNAAMIGLVAALRANANQLDLSSNQPLDRLPNWKLTEKK